MPTTTHMPDLTLEAATPLPFNLENIFRGSHGRYGLYYGS